MKKTSGIFLATLRQKDSRRLFHHYFPVNVISQMSASLVDVK
jgi:hypothetical protein